jgi:hypothetical protein
MLLFSLEPLKLFPETIDKGFLLTLERIFKLYFLPTKLNYYLSCRFNFLLDLKMYAWSGLLFPFVRFFS